MNISWWLGLSLIMIRCVVASPQSSTEASPVSPAKPAIAVTIKAAHEVVKSGTEVRVIVTTTNASDHPLKFLYVPRRYIPEDFSIGIEVWDSNDVLLSPRKPQNPNAMLTVLSQSPVSSETLQPG